MLDQGFLKLKLVVKNAHRLCSTTIDDFFSDFALERQSKT